VFLASPAGSLVEFFKNEKNRTHAMKVITSCNHLDVNDLKQ
jgi:hypothetical protein